MGWGFRPYVPVHVRRDKAKKKIAKMKMEPKPIEIEGRKIASTFWGKAWCSHIEAFSDYENRLPRGRTYVRNGSVCHLEMKKGEVKALVSGSSLYNVKITIQPIKKPKWQTLKKSCRGKISSILDLLSGKLSDGVMDVVCHEKEGLFPLSHEIKLHCDCPDWAVMCKHVAAVLYGVGARLDSAPAELFTLRGADYEEMVDLSQAVTELTSKGEGKQKRLSEDKISDVFDFEVHEEDSEKPKAKAPKKVAKTTSKTTRKATSKAKVTRTGKVVSRKRLPKAASKAKGTVGKTTTSKSKTAKKAAPKRQNKKIPKNLPKTITGFAVKKQRNALDLTKTACAEKLGVSIASIAVWEAFGRKKVSVTERSMEKLQQLWT